MFQTVDKLEKFERLPTVFLFYNNIKPLISTMGSLTSLLYRNYPNKKRVAQQVGVGAVIFNDLKYHRLNDIEFSIEQMMHFEGETGPYVQYTYARLCSILEKANAPAEVMTFQPLGEQAWPIVLLLEQFPKVVATSFDQADPSQIAKYALQLARLLNKYYAQQKILADDEYQASRLALCSCVAIVLKRIIRFIGH